MVSQDSPPAWNPLRAAGRRIAERLISVARSRLETPLNVFMIRCDICGLLKVAQVLEQPPSECPLCTAPITVLAECRVGSPMRWNTDVSDDRDRGTARGTRVTTASREANT